MKRKILYFVLNFFAGKLFFQKIFENLHSVAIYGMNYGNGGNFRKSGEYYATEYVKTTLLKKYKTILSKTAHCDVPLDQITPYNVLEPNYGTQKP